MHSGRYCIKIMDVDFIVHMVMNCFLRYQMVKSILLSDKRSCLTNAATKRELIDVCILVLHI